MAKIQTRKCVGLSRRVYDAFKSHCAAAGLAKAALAEELILQHIRSVAGEPGWPGWAEIERRAREDAVPTQQPNGPVPVRVVNRRAAAPPPAMLMVGVAIADTPGARLQRRLAEVEAKLARTRGEEARAPLEEEREVIERQLLIIRDNARAEDRRRTRAS